RVREAREALASVAAVPVDEWRQDLSSGPSPAGLASSSHPRRRGTGLVRRRDLECTIFRMLLANDEFFNYFVSHLAASDPVRDPFRKLAQRVDRVLVDLDNYHQVLLQEQQPGGPSSAPSAPSGPPSSSSSRIAASSTLI